MTDRAYWLKLYVVSAVVCAVAIAASWPVWASPAVALGLAAGYALGVFPFATWPWIIGSAGRRRAVFAVLLLVVKMAVYGASLWWLLATREPRVNPLALLAGITIASATFFAMPPRASEGLKCT